MELLKDKIKKEGRVTEDNILMVDSFLNHQMDVEFFNEVGKEFKDRFKNDYQETREKRYLIQKFIHSLKKQYTMLLLIRNS